VRRKDGWGDGRAEGDGYREGDRDRKRGLYLGREGYGTERGTRWGMGRGTGREIKSKDFKVEMVHC
jgi:hypothetical protein